MGRVWKRTFYKIGLVLGFVGGITGWVLGCAWIGHYFFNSFGGGLLASLLISSGGMFIHSAYREAKREVERENDELMRQLKQEYKQ